MPQLSIIQLYNQLHKNLCSIYAQLQALGGRIRKKWTTALSEARLSGTIVYDGNPFIFNSRSAFVIDEEDPPIFGNLTVQETFLLATYFQFHKLTAEARTEKIESMLRQLHLRRCRYFLVGATDKKRCRLNGGERKRLSIGKALMVDPEILFCDEVRFTFLSHVAE